ncbi:hypothetical protein ACFYUV_49885 [Nonomuraea sp. NPDC003560]|uniref:hypothetical protein n=1 Tax=Nonomuraea sp. NPDC003560 TaxID=3364341 RepID=UPI0036760535
MAPTANPNMHRAYALAIDRVTARLGRDRPLAEVADAEIGAALTELWACPRDPLPLSPLPCGTESREVLLQMNGK